MVTHCTYLCARNRLALLVTYLDQDAVFTHLRGFRLNRYRQLKGPGIDEFGIFNTDVIGSETGQ